MEKIEFINIYKPKMFLRWYLDEHNFIKVQLIKVKE